jgi:hypothetical protein
MSKIVKNIYISCCVPTFCGVSNFEKLNDNFTLFYVGDFIVVTIKSTNFWDVMNVKDKYKFTDILQDDRREPNSKYQRAVCRKPGSYIYRSSDRANRSKEKSKYCRI